MKIHERDIRNPVTYFLYNFTDSIFVKKVLLEVVNILTYFVNQVIVDGFAPHVTQISLQDIERGLYCQNDKIYSDSPQNSWKNVWVCRILCNRINDAFVDKCRDDFGNTECECNCKDDKKLGSVWFEELEGLEDFLHCSHSRCLPPPSQQLFGVSG